VTETPQFLADVVFDAPQHGEELIAVEFKPGDVLLHFTGDDIETSKKRQLAFSQSVENLALFAPDLIDGGAIAHQLQMAEMVFHVAVSA
jgi:hypothetical protein